MWSLGVMWHPQAQRWWPLMLTDETMYLNILTFFMQILTCNIAWIHDRHDVSTLYIGTFCQMSYYKPAYIFNFCPEPTELNKNESPCHQPVVTHKNCSTHMKFIVLFSGFCPMMFHKKKCEYYSAVYELYNNPFIVNLYWNRSESWLHQRLWVSNVLSLWRSKLHWL